MNWCEARVTASDDYNRIDIIHKETIRCTTKSRYNAPTDPICKEYKILGLYKPIKLEFLKLGYRYKKICHLKESLAYLTRKDNNNTRLLSKMSNYIPEPVVRNVDKYVKKFLSGN